MPSSSLTWNTATLTLEFSMGASSPVCLKEILPAGACDLTGDASEPTRSHAGIRQPLHLQALVELYVAGRGHARSSERAVESKVGRELRYESHSTYTEDGFDTLEITQRHPGLGLIVTSVIRAPKVAAAFQSITSVTNRGSNPVTLYAVSSFVLGLDKHNSGFEPRSTSVSSAKNEWLAENRWTTRPVILDDLVDLDLGVHDQDPRGALTVSSAGSWSTGRVLPMGVLSDSRTHRAVAWQIEHNGGWLWEVGERRQGLYLATFGPEDREHQWRHVLGKGETFSTVPVGVSISDQGLGGAISELTHYRRALRPHHPDLDELPVIYNDYMNTIDGDPTTKRLLPLIDAAASVGAEYFVIDAGWYDDSSDWWDAVGEWLPAKVRFPEGGLSVVVDHIRACGMRPGLWLEPEIVGCCSPAMADLPKDAFFQRDGELILEHGRHHLDLTHPAAIQHLNNVIARLIEDFGIEYFKFDYNINAGPGTDRGTDSPGDGLLNANRAQLSWIRDLLRHHPRLVIENCASGAMRADYASLFSFQIQSTSDQQNPRLYPPIAASAPMSIAPEQAANWSYPQPEMTDEELSFTLVTGMLGRLYLSGFLEQMSAKQRSIVSDAVTIYKGIRSVIRQSTPTWPLGLPAWNDNVVALVLRTADIVLLNVWNRDSSSGEIVLRFPELRGYDVGVEELSPVSLPSWESKWDPLEGILYLHATPGIMSARLFRLTQSTGRL